VPKKKTGGKPVKNCRTVPTQAQKLGALRAEKAYVEAVQFSKNVSLTDIIADESVQARVELSEETVADYRAAMLEQIEEKGAHSFPPLVVFQEGKTLWLSSGFHRFEAAKRTSGKVSSFPCEIRKGTKRNAQLFALGANADHGLHRTSADKRKAVALMLQDDEWKDWSSRQIAKQCNVSPSLVDNIRNESPSSDSELVTADIGSESQASAGAAEAEGEGRKYITKHGTKSTMRRRRGTASRRSRQQASDEESEPEKEAEESEPEGESEPEEESKSEGETASPALPVAGPQQEEKSDEEGDDAEEDESASLVAGAHHVALLDEAEVTALRSANEKLTRDKQALEGRVKQLESALEMRLGENETLKARVAELAAKGTGSMSDDEFLTALKKWEETDKVNKTIIADKDTKIARLENENANLRAQVAAPPDGAPR